MKFRIDRSVLADAVSWAARGLPSRPSMPVLAGLVLEAGQPGSSDDSSTLTVSAFDYEVSSRVSVVAEVTEPGRALVSGRLLAEIARSLPDRPVDFVGDGSKVVLTCGSARFTLLTMPVEDYPRLPELPAVTGRIASEVFAAAVNQVVVASGRDDTLPVLTGVLMEIEGDKIVFWTTDRYRLAVRELNWRPASPSISATALVPARTLHDAARSLTGGPDLALALAASGAGDGLLGFEGGATEEDGTSARRSTTRLLDGEFPKVRSLFPAESPIQARVETAAFVESLKRVSLVAERNTPVRLTFEDGTLTLEAGASDEAQASEAIDAATVGDPISIAFNPAYLLDGLNSIGQPYVVLSFTLPTKPTVITGAADETAEPDAAYRYLLMPIRLSG